MQISICCICGTPITNTFWVCEACERGYKLPGLYRDWPEWAKMLKGDEAKRRARAKSRIEIIPISLLSDTERDNLDRLFYGEKE